MKPPQDPDIGCSLVDSLEELKNVLLPGGYDLQESETTVDHEESAYSDVPGWTQAPRHYCKVNHDDPAGLAWCCHPVKNCPLRAKLKKFGIDPKLYLEIKENWAKENNLYGRVCFDNLAYCCKKKVCYVRDPALENLSLSLEEYYSLKKGLGEYFREIVQRINNGDSAEKILEEPEKVPI